MSHHYLCHLRSCAVSPSGKCSGTASSSKIGGILPQNIGGICLLLIALILVMVMLYVPKLVFITGWAAIDAGFHTRVDLCRCLSICWFASGALSLGCSWMSISSVCVVLFGVSLYVPAILVFPVNAAPVMATVSCNLCIRGCGQKTFNGHPNEYCSHKCRDLLCQGHCGRPAAFGMLTCGNAECNLCIRGCGQKTFNGHPNEYCSHRCRDLLCQVQCGRPAAFGMLTCGNVSCNLCIRGCGQKTFNGHPNEYCSHMCRNLLCQVQCGRPAAFGQMTCGNGSCPSHLCIRGCGRPAWPGNNCQICHSQQMQQLREEQERQAQWQALEAAQVQARQAQALAEQEWQRQQIAQPEIAQEACLSQQHPCWRRECSKLSWNGMEKEYCSSSCRDWGLHCKVCQRSGCTKEVPCCSMECNDMVSSQQVQVLCSRPGCGEPTWNGLAGEWCTIACRDQPEVASEGGPAEPVVHYPLFLSPSQSGYAIQGIAAASALRADRFDAEELQPVSAGTSHVRSPHYRQFCGVNSPPLCMLLRKLVRKIRKPNDTDAEALLRVYTSDEQYEDGRPLFHSINQGLYKDDQQLLQACGGFIHALRWAMQDKCRKDNVSQGVVYRSVTLSAVQLEQYKVGFKFLYPNFVSTSWKSDQIFGEVKHGYTRAKFVIDLDGDGLTYALDIASWSEFSDEREVLIYPYSGFEVQDLQTEGGLTTIYLRTVDTIKFESTKHLCPIASPFSLDLSIA